MKLIVEMEKVPKNCDDSCWGELSGECQWSDHIDGYTMNSGRPQNCPIKGVLSDEHGRLVDANNVELAMVEKGQGSSRYKLGEIWELNGLEIREALQTVPTIVPATERKNDGKTTD